MSRVVYDCDKLSGADGVPGMFPGILEGVTMRAVVGLIQRMTDGRRPFARHGFAHRLMMDSGSVLS